MVRSAEALVTPDVLAWARQRRRLSPEEAAKKAQVKVERLLRWEAGEERPSVAKARALAKAYGYPLAVFYLAQPPTDFDAMQVPDFRGKGTADYSRDLALQIRDAWRAHLAAVEIAGDLGEVQEPLQVQDATSLDSDELAGRVRQHLGVSFAEQRRWRDKRVAYNAWRALLEDHGFLAFQFSGVDLDEARAFSLDAATYPVIAVNSKDAYAGRAFSLFHELAHLLLGGGGVCDEDDTRAEEAFCNSFAGALLVPQADLLAHDLVQANSGATWDDDDLRKIARNFAVSEEVVLRRLLALGLTSAQFYRRKRKEYLARYAELADRQEGGPVPFPTRVIARFGRRYVRRVLIAVDADRLTASAASNVLGARLRHFRALEERAFG